MFDQQQLEQWDRAHFFHPSTHMAQHAHGDTPNRIITGGSGVYIEDARGKKSLDGFAGLYCVNVGYGRTEIADAIARQAHTLPYYHAYVKSCGFTTETGLVEYRVRFTPGLAERRPKASITPTSACPAPMPTRPTSSWSGTTTTSSDGRKRKRSFRAGAATTARESSAAA